MAEEYLYGVTLDSAKTSEVWDHEPKNDESDSNQHFGVEQKLIIKMALLGPEAKPGELNVLQVEAMGLKGPIKIPIALLEMGKTSQIILDLSFPDPPVTFTLIKGSGPVHIVGHNLLEFEDMEDDEVEVDNLDDEDDEKEPQKKRKLFSEIKKNGTKRAKMDEGVDK
ncbi:PREDICTED: nucleoplasmin-like protein isoform X4 [Ceratosolen solmsi marchali]|uniref:Nucleoplasmin-like protein isoform X4 n=1 Tax=Ceratosolen solmsi marchali TaxID=326594 RepID=A0AAJ7DZ21_9HYME|nr:PREDICTED: nucleoplasmin-like protein isoform X4 [Ceratosolen solmsi marchali]